MRQCRRRSGPRPLLDLGTRRPFEVADDASSVPFGDDPETAESLARMHPEQRRLPPSLAGEQHVRALGGDFIDDDQASLPQHADQRRDVFGRMKTGVQAGKLEYDGRYHVLEDQAGAVEEAGSRIGLHEVRKRLSIVPGDGPFQKLRIVHIREHLLCERVAVQWRASLTPLQGLEPELEPVRLILEVLLVRIGMEGPPLVIHVPQRFEVEFRCEGIQMGVEREDAGWGFLLCQPQREQQVRTMREKEVHLLRKHMRMTVKLVVATYFFESGLALEENIGEVNLSIDVSCRSHLYFPNWRTNNADPFIAVFSARRGCN